MVYTENCSYWINFFCWCLCCNSSSRIIRAMRCLSLMLLPLAANEIFANVGIKCSTLHIIRSLISGRVFAYLVFIFSKVLTTVKEVLHKVDSIEQRRFYWNRAHSNCSFASLKWFRKVHVHHGFLINDDKSYRHYLSRK